MQRRLGDLALPPEGMTTVDFAHRVGVHRSTLHRIASGEVEPTVATLRELAIEHGLGVRVATEPLSDPDAAVGARLLLDPAWNGTGSGSARRWAERLRRRGALDDPLEGLRFAARSSSLLHRTSAAFLRGPSGAPRLASAGAAADGFWAVSGRPALELRAPALRGPAVLWVDDVDRAARLLADSHAHARVPRTADVIVAPAGPSITIDAFELDRVRYVAPIQMLLDGLGLGGALAAAAETIAEGWSRD